jgi:hypothetical protein
MSWSTNVLTVFAANCRTRAAGAIPIPGCCSITRSSSICAPRNGGPGTTDLTLRRTKRRSATTVDISSSPSIVASSELRVIR